MTFEVFNWAGERKVNEAITALGYEHRQIVEGDVLEAAQKFLDAGVNVMVVKQTDPNFTLALDTKSFGQR